jgi:hypothetical protein
MGNSLESTYFCGALIVDLTAPSLLLLYQELDHFIGRELFQRGVMDCSPALFSDQLQQKSGVVSEGLQTWAVFSGRSIARSEFISR